MQFYGIVDGQKQAICYNTNKNNTMLEYALLFMLAGSLIAVGIGISSRFFDKAEIMPSPSARFAVYSILLYLVFIVPPLFLSYRYAYSYLADDVFGFSLLFLWLGWPFVAVELFLYGKKRDKSEYSHLRFYAYLSPLAGSVLALIYCYGLGNCQGTLMPLLAGPLMILSFILWFYFRHYLGAFISLIMKKSYGQ